MRAVGLTAPSSRLQELELPVPDPGPDELLVRVIASSINPVDAYIVNGTYATGGLEYPVVPGRDLYGVVERAGARANGFAPGDRVLGCWTSHEFRLGAWAEYMIVPTDAAVTHCPAALTPHEAAALPLAAATAQIGIDGLSPGPGEPLLIVGAAGAVGCYAVQLAAQRGARVIATGKPGAEQRLRSLGAAETIDYTRQDVAAVVRDLHPAGIPMLFDIVGDKPDLLRLAELVQDGGRVASARFAADRRALSARGIEAINVVANGHGAEVLDATLTLAESGALHVLCSEVRPLTDLPNAVSEFAEGGRGKVVIDVGAQ
jgi:2-desacetyl-2-hydroxyethyl bacteriochlorophyllide A dehydrogenase